MIFIIKLVETLYFPYICVRVQARRWARSKKKKDTLARKNTPKGDISGITEKDDIHPRNYCSHWRCSKRKGVLRNFTKFTRKDLFFNKATGLRPTTLLNKKLWRRCFPVSFAKFLRALYLQNTPGRLLLEFQLFSVLL